MSDRNEVPEAQRGTFEELKETFVDTMLAQYDTPKTMTIPGAEEYPERKIRFQLDNLLSILEETHKEYKVHFAPNAQTDILIPKLERFTTFCRKASDLQMAEIFANYAMNQAPRVAWWTASSTDWISDIPTSDIDFSNVIKNAKGREIPSLPVGIIYKEGAHLRSNAEMNAEVLAPMHAILCTKIARYFYGTMKVALEMKTEELGGTGEEARAKQCERKMRVLAVALEASNGEDDDFIDVLLGAISLSATGPDGEKVNTKTIKKALGAGFQNGILHDILALIPDLMTTSNNPQDLKDALQNNPKVQSIFSLAGGSQQAGALVDMLSSTGMLSSDSFAMAKENSVKSNKKKGSLSK